MLYFYLIRFTFRGSLADLTSLEELLSLFMTRNLISPLVIKHLWNVFGTTKVEIPLEQRRGAIIVLTMFAKETKDVMDGRIDLLLKILARFGKVMLL